jgi:hypothetical protein
MDCIKKNRARHGMRKETALSWRLNRLIDRMISMISQDRLSGGTHKNRYKRRVNPESIRLNPKLRSNLAPTKRINGNWVNKIAMALKIFNLCPAN